MGCGGSRTQEGIVGSKPSQNKSKVVFVVGGPGSGKGTQCALLVQEFGFIHLSSGDLLRDEVKNQGPQAEIIAEKQKEGVLVDDATVVKLIKAAFEKSGNIGKKYLLDGFPRSLANLEAWKSIIGDDIEVSFLLYFSCSLETMGARLLKRGESSGRSDDNVETIQKRFYTFQTDTQPIIDVFRNNGTLVEVDSDREKEQVGDDIRVIIKSKNMG